MEGIECAKVLGLEGIRQPNTARAENVETMSSLVRHISELHFY